MNRIALAAVIFCSSIRAISAQAPGVPVYDETRLKRADAAAKKAAVELQKAGELLDWKRVAEQLDARKHCKLKLPPPGKEKLPPRDLWNRARQSHLRIGWLFHDHEKPRWQASLAGGYFITGDGAAATCYHVVEPHESEMKDGWLFAATDDDKVYPVTEILAASHDTDTCILRVKADKVTALPLGTDVVPGDTVVCFSEPMGRRGYFSASVVNRFVQRPVAPLRKRDAPPELPPVFLEVGTDWAPGSSGAAVLDLCGNAVGHVATIESIVDEGDPSQRKRSLFPGTVIVLHDAICARHVKDLVTEK